MNALPLLELRGITVHRDGVAVLRGVSLTVEAGEFVALLGANGAGKSATLGAVSGTVKASGEVELEGSRIYRRTPEAMARRGVMHVPEGRGTFATVSVLDNLRLGAWMQRGTSTRDLVRVFELYPRLYEHREKRAGLLTAADQQLLALGRAMMAKPRLLLLDEPSRGLEAPAARDTYAGLRMLNETGTTIVVGEEKPGLALAAAGHAIVLEAGRVVLDGTADDLRRNDAARRSYLGY